MVRTADIIGALLRGLTTARIQSDVFSSQASQEYLASEGLRNYPVPRAEIRQADITMHMAVLETVQRTVDNLGILELHLQAALPGYVQELLAIVVASSVNPALVQPLSQHLGPQQAAYSAALVTTLESWIAANLALVNTELLGSPKTFGSKTWRNQTSTAMQSTATSLAVPVTLTGANFIKAVQAISTPFAERMQAEIQLELDLAASSFFDLDLAVKKDQILTLPAHVISEIKLTVVMDNYEWASVTNAQGQVINRLTHK
jgi:hypothetical protein